MGTVSTSEFRAGLKIMIDGDPCNIIEVQFVKPGKGQAFYRTKWRNLNTGRVNERNIKSGDTMESADIVETEMQFLYADADGHHFMDPGTYEQVAATGAAVEEAAKWLKPEDRCQVMLYNGIPIAVTAPMFVTLVVKETDPGVRGDTSSGGTKPATMETGAVVKVPLFIQEGELIRIDTRTGTYLSRGKDES